MNPKVFTNVGTLLASVNTPTGVAFYHVDQQVDVAKHMRDGTAWIKLYAPSQEAERDVLEEYLVMIDIGARNLETARVGSAAVRKKFRGAQRAPTGYTLRRLVMLEEENYVRFQHAYRLIQQPGEGN